MPHVCRADPRRGVRPVLLGDALARWSRVVPSRPDGATPCREDALAAVAADNPHALRWLRGCGGTLGDMPSERTLVECALAWGSVAVLRALLDANPFLYDPEMLLKEIHDACEAEVLELVRRALLRLRASSPPAVSPEDRDMLATLAEYASVCRHASVVEAIVCAGVSPADHTESLLRVGLGRLVRPQEWAQLGEERLPWAVRCGDTQRAAEELSGWAGRRDALDILSAAAMSPHAYDTLCWAHGVVTAMGVTTDGPVLVRAPGRWQSPRDEDWRDTILDYAMCIDVDRSAGALRWLVERAAFVPHRGNLQTAIHTEADCYVRRLARHIRPARPYLERLLSRALVSEEYRMADALADALAYASDCDCGSPKDDSVPADYRWRPRGMWLLLAIGDCGKQRARAYGAALLRRRRGLLPAADGEFLRVCDDPVPQRRQLAALAWAGYRLDGDRAAWLDWLWPDRARPGRAPSALDVLYAYRLHSRYTRATRPACATTTLPDTL